MSGSNNETQEVLLWSGQQYRGILLTPLLSLITARECVGRLGTEVHPMIQTFPKYDTVFQDENGPIYTARSVQSRFEYHKN
jgi:hypothetical protein